MSASFAVRLALATPIALNGLLHLDGLLGALLTARGGTLADIPLDRAMGAWQGSAAMLETGPFGAAASNVPRIKRIDGEAAEATLSHLPRRARTIGNMHPMRTRLTEHPVMAGVRAAWFAACGDKDRTLDLLADLRGLGAMNRTGWGRVDGMEAVDLADAPDTGLLLASGLPARSLALAAWDASGRGRPQGALIGAGRAAPPYWTGAEGPCILPAQHHLTGTARELMRTMHA